MKWGLNLKFICYTVFIVVFISLVFSVVFIFQSRAALLQEFNKRATALVQNLAYNIEVPLLIENREALTELAQNLLKEESVQEIKIYNKDNVILLSLGKHRRLMPWHKEIIRAPVYFSPEEQRGPTEDMHLFYDAEGVAHNVPSGPIIGSIEVLFSREGIIRRLNAMRWWIFVAATIAACIGGIAALYFSRTLILPIQRLARGTHAIARGNWDERLTIGRRDELGQLTEAFNMMAASLKEHKAQLEHTYRELALRETMAEIGKFSMIIAHELKNPLGIIKGAVDILAKNNISPHMKETMIGYIRDEVRRLNKQVEDFLAFARPAPPQKTKTDMNELVRTVAMRSALSDEEKTRIGLELKLCPRAEVVVDENQMYQVLLNLITNAVQAINGTGTITMKTTCEHGTVVVTIEDTGCGISPDIKEKIFEPFFTTKSQGTGLGLAIVKKFIESNGGTVTITDRAGGGTCVRLTLPVAHV
ncbi:MAG: ATP-binding protein [Desulfobacterota bacterium]|nr:ATP-binding protein [Thermodesulfobacteriota bacterium]